MLLKEKMTNVKTQSSKEFQMTNAKTEISNQCQSSKSINNPPSPPFSKGGVGGFEI
jgi:hypothetical protein